MPKGIRIGDGCGTHAGWNRHKRAGEEPCDACRDARRAYYREWQRRKRAGLTKTRKTGPSRNARIIIGLVEDYGPTTRTFIVREMDLRRGLTQRHAYRIIRELAEAGTIVVDDETDMIAMPGVPFPDTAPERTGYVPQGRVGFGITGTPERPHGHTLEHRQ